MMDINLFGEARALVHDAMSIHTLAPQSEVRVQGCQRGSTGRIAMYVAAGKVLSSVSKSGPDGEAWLWWAYGGRRDGSTYWRALRRLTSAWYRGHSAGLTSAQVGCLAYLYQVAAENVASSQLGGCVVRSDARIADICGIAASNYRRDGWADIVASVMSDITALDIQALAPVIAMLKREREASNSGIMA